MFETGRGVPRNYQEAAMWYRRAAEQGDSLAQIIGLLYESGQRRGSLPTQISIRSASANGLSVHGTNRPARRIRSPNGSEL